MIFLIIFEKVLCYTQFKIYYSEKTHCYIIPANFCEKLLKLSLMYFHRGKKIKIKHFAEKSFSLFGGAHRRPLNTLNLFWAKCFIIFVLRL